MKEETEEITLNIQGTQVRVSKGFLSLSPIEQNKTVDEIAASMGIRPGAKQSQPAAPVIEQRPEQPSPPETSFARAQAPAAMMMFPGESFGMPVQSLDAQERRQVGGNIVRYGVPAVAQFAASPLSAAGPLGIAALSGIGAAVGYPSSLLGQLIAGEEVSHREAAADAAMFAMPFSAKGGFFGRAAFNVPAAIATVEGSEYIRNGEYQPPKSTGEAFARWGAVAGLATGVSYLGARSQRVQEVAARRAELAAERYGGTSMLSESLPQFTGVEQRAVQAGSKRALKLMEEMDASFNQAVAEAFPEGQSTQPLRQFLRGRQAHVQRLKEEAEQARNAAMMARRRADELSGGDDLRAYEAARRTAAETAFTARAARMAQEWTEQAALGRNVLNASDVNIGNQVRSVNEMMQAGRAALSAGIDAAYREVGISVNTPVLSLKGALNAIDSSARSPKSTIGGKIAKAEYKAFVQSYFDKYGTSSVKGGPKDTLSLEAHRRMQRELANEMAPNGRFASLSEAQASEIYNATKRASDRYIKQNMPDAFPAWQRAREIAERDFGLRKTDAIKLLENGNIEGFHAALLSEGQGQTMEAIGQYARLLASAGQPEAAQAFVGSVNRIIAHGVLHRAAKQSVGGGIDAITQLVDPKILLREIDTLRSYGFPVDQLGLGTREQIRAAARLNSVQASGGVTKEMLDEFYQLSETIGVRRATARINYYQAVRDEQLANGTRQQRLKAYQARQAAKEAGATADDRATALLRAQDDPLNRLITDKSFPVPSGATNSAKFNASLMSMEPSTASAFVEAMEQAGRGADLENLRRGLMYGVMNKHTTNQYGQQVLDTRGIINFFDSPDAVIKSQREVFQRIIGTDAYNNIENNFLKPLRRIGQVQATMDYTAGGSLPTLVTRARPPDGNLVKATMVVTTNTIVDLLNAARYNTLYALYVSPTTAPMWNAAMRSGGDLAKQPVLVTAIRLAEEQDRKDAEQGR